MELDNVCLPRPGMSMASSSPFYLSLIGDVVTNRSGVEEIV